ncbi:IMPACT family protein [Propionibacterium sp.]|uniref:IMPACT family protein n=1 Tax=Propionibacterium sp. TaxID=1977903 RepID=UPI0039E8F973
MPPDQYVTLGAAVRHEVEISRSRFIACLFPVADEQLARGRITALRREFHDARHLPSAFVLGPNRNQQRTSDDGEPSGTSGVPILNALTSHVCATGRAELTDVLAVVVRYFGGIKLGAGGLVRAYGGTVSAALAHAAMIRRVHLDVLTVHLPVGSAGRLEAALRGSGLSVLDVSWPGSECVIEIGFPRQNLDITTDRIAELTAGTASITPTPSRWVDLPL